MFLSLVDDWTLCGPFLLCLCISGDRSSRLFFKYWHQEELARLLDRLGKAAVAIQKSMCGFAVCLRLRVEGKLHFIHAGGVAGTLQHATLLNDCSAAHFLS